MDHLLSIFPRGCNNKSEADFNGVVHSKRRERYLFSKICIDLLKIISRPFRQEYPRVLFAAERDSVNKGKGTDGQDRGAAKKGLWRDLL